LLMIYSSLSSSSSSSSSHLWLFFVSTSTCMKGASPASVNLENISPRQKVIKQPSD
jgi:hypothetical protein